MKTKYIDIIKQRRSNYDLKKESTITDEEVVELVENVVKESPSAFNSQSARSVILFGKHHNRLWQIVEDALRTIIPSDKFGETEARINGFKNAYGTILFFEDINVVKGLQESFPLYSENFPIWSQQSTGIVQINIWNAFSEVGLGVNLQHYSNLIEESVKKEWDLPDNWSLTAQMLFGTPGSKPGTKDYQDINNRLKVFK